MVDYAEVDRKVRRLAKNITRNVHLETDTIDVPYIEETRSGNVLSYRKEPLHGWVLQRYYKSLKEYWRSDSYSSATLQEHSMDRCVFVLKTNGDLSCFLLTYVLQHEDTPQVSLSYGPRLRELPASVTDFEMLQPENVPSVNNMVWSKPCVHVLDFETDGYNERHGDEDGYSIVQGDAPRMVRRDYCHQVRRIGEGVKSAMRELEARSQASAPTPRYVPRHMADK